MRCHHNKPAYSITIPLSISLSLLALLILPPLLAATDAPPAVITTNPPHAATNIPLNPTLTITFTEPVTLTTTAFQLDCAISGIHSTTASGGPTQYTITPLTSLTAQETCVATIFANQISDHDTDDPPDHMFTNYEWSFTTTSAPPTPQHILINEADAHTADSSDFIELYDGGSGNTTLTGLTLALYQGDTDTIYATIDLANQQTNASGYALITATLHDGPAAVALYDTTATTLSIGATLTTNGLLDALVYDTGQPDDLGLLQLLQPNQPQVNENGRHHSLTHSLQRCPNGTGGQRQTTPYRPNPPTPNAANDCTPDAAPDIIAKSPPDGALEVYPNATLTITFTEPVHIGQQTFHIDCTQTGEHTFNLSGNATTYTLHPQSDFAFGEQCLITTFAQHVHDTDTDDPPNTMLADDFWQFTTLLPIADHILINELDSDTPGPDTAEFIELYDGGVGNTDLSGLALVLFNGADGRSYHTFDLDSYQTDEQGYFLLGNAAVPGIDLTFADTLLQNGPDAIALYNASLDHIPNGTPVTSTIATSIRLIDALVYGRPDQTDHQLLPLMNPGQTQADENGRANQDTHANQRCPNGTGGQRNSYPFKQNPPTPGTLNNCITDEAPAVASTIPARGETIVPINSPIQITFREPVQLAGQWFQIQCEQSGIHSAAVSGGPQIYTLTPNTPFATEEECTVTILASQINDLDDDDPPDQMTANYIWRFTTAPPVADFVLINELDSDTSSSDTAEFIELYDGGTGNTNLTGLSLVFFNGSTDTSYYAIDLAHQQTNNNGYFFIGNAAITNADFTFPNNTLQNGPDAVALYAARATAFPNGSPLTITNLIDAVVYDTADADDLELLTLLNPGQPQVNEDGRGNAETHSIQRCPNGSGGRRNTQSFRPSPPTPKANNICTSDNAPTVLSITPPAGATAVPINTPITITFSEPVSLAGEWHDLSCTISGRHALQTTGGPTTYTATPTTPFAYGESCDFTTHATNIHDQDNDDPPDNMAADYTWNFATLPPLPVAEHILINELDSDTSGSDTAEFIELYDGGTGNTDLTGLTLVFYNGSTDSSYRAVSLDGRHTNSQGYFTIGNSETPNVDLVIPNGILQNGPDAVALYARPAASFPTGTPITTTGLLDAVVYTALGGEASATLLTLLHSGQPTVNENGRSNREGDSNQRCPNGSGGQRKTATILQDHPTPGRANDCTFDAPPQLITITPASNAKDVPTDTTIKLSFSEPVLVQSAWATLTCGVITHNLTTSGGPTQYTLTPTDPLAADSQCTATIHAAHISDLDQDDPPDTMQANYIWQFTTAAVPTADFVLINEVDSDTAEADTAEFIELYDGGVGNTPLTGLVVVLFNGNDDRSYRTIELTGQQTDANGYFVIGNAAVPNLDLTIPNNILQNGPDAVALYASSSANFPNSTSLTTTGLLDAIVYGTADPTDSELLTLLNPGQPQVDESSRGAAEAHSNQRCPNASGDQRNTNSYLQNQPTPGTTSNCQISQPDQPPTIIEVTPSPNANNIAPNTHLTIIFSEPIQASANAFTLTCTTSGDIALNTSGGPIQHTIAPIHPLSSGETCTATIHAATISDLDTNDPPDNMTEDYTWQFTIETTTIIDPPDFILINEVDADTEGSDTAEFIELYDGGRGHTDLTGLILVLYNGSTNQSYRTIDLAGQQTNAAGYLLLGNPALPAVDLTFANGQLQNGPDAIALYAGTAADFPNGSELTTNGLLDALVYGTADPIDNDLLILLNNNQPQVDEDGRNAKDHHTNQRCPNASGGQRNTTSYLQNPPTPKAPNNCQLDQPDEAPSIVETTPPPNADNIDPHSQLTITFSESVQTTTNAFTLTCTTSGDIDLSTNGGPTQYTITPIHSLPSGETCTATIHAAAISDLDTNDPPDNMAADYTWQFTIEAIDSTDPPDFILINEADADTEGSDTAEFIELYDGGTGNTNLSGLILVLYNGATDTSYRTFDLTGRQTDDAGYFLLGNSAIPAVDLTFSNGQLQNGPDAIALYVAPATDFPNGSQITDHRLLDALVYTTNDQTDTELLTLLNPGQQAANENGRDNKDHHANQRCPNGAGGQRNTASFQQNTPTPKAANNCTIDPPDQAPAIIAVTPAHNSNDIDPNTQLTITFSESVQATANAFTLTCASGDIDLSTSGGPTQYTITPINPLPSGETCTATIYATAISDLDDDDPPDNMAADYIWTFTSRTADNPPPPPLTASFIHNGPVTIGRTSHFTATTTSPTPLTYTWDFGDGTTTATGPAVTHSYATPGAYTVTLTVSNGRETATAAITHTITPSTLYLPIQYLSNR